MAALLRAALYDFAWVDMDVDQAEALLDSLTINWKDHPADLTALEIQEILLNEVSLKWTNAGWPKFADGDTRLRDFFVHFLKIAYNNGYRRARAGT